MSIIARIRGALRPKPPTTTTPAPAPYRREPDDDLAQLLDELEHRMGALALRCQALEAQLAARGELPVSTPAASDLREILEVLDVLGDARGWEQFARWNTLEFRSMAEALRSLLRSAAAR